MKKEYTPKQVKELRKFVAIIGMEAVVLGAIIIGMMVMMHTAEVEYSYARRFSHLVLALPAMLMIIFGKDFADMTNAMNALPEYKKGKFMDAPLTRFHRSKAIIFPIVSTLVLGLLFMSLYKPSPKEEPVRIDKSEQITPDTSSSLKDFIEGD